MTTETKEKPPSMWSMIGWILVGALAICALFEKLFPHMYHHVK